MNRIVATLTCPLPLVAWPPAAQERNHDTVTCTAMAAGASQVSIDAGVQVPGVSGCRVDAIKNRYLAGTAPTSTTAPTGRAWYGAVAEDGQIWMTCDDPVVEATGSVAFHRSHRWKYRMAGNDLHEGRNTCVTYATSDTTLAANGLEDSVLVEAGTTFRVSGLTYIDFYDARGSLVDFRYYDVNWTRQVPDHAEMAILCSALTDISGIPVQDPSVQWWYQDGF